MAKHINEMQHFRILPSSRAGVVNGVLHCVAILACWLSNLQMSSQTILTSLICIFWWVAKMRWNATPVYLRYTGNNGWRVSFDGNSYHSAVILDTTIITSVVMFLHYNTENQAFRSLMIAKDSLSNNEFRRLRVRLTLSMRG